MSPFLFDADAAHTPEGERRRAETIVADPSVLSISDLFATFAKAVKSGDQVSVKRIRRSASPQLLAELDGFNYPAAA